MNAVIQINHISASRSTTNPPPSTLNCSKVSGDADFVSVDIKVPAADTDQYSVGQQFTISG